MIDHRGEGRHPVNQILLPFLINVFPIGIRFTGKIIRNVVAVDRNLGESGELPGIRDQTRTALPGKAFLSQYVPTLAVGIEVDVASFGRRVKGKVRRRVSQVKEERFVLFLGLLEELDRIVVEGIGRVKIIRIELQFGLFALGQAHVIAGLPLARAVTADITIVFVETTVRRCFLMSDVPLPHSVGPVTRRLEDFGQSHALLVQFAQVGRPQTIG